MREYSLGEQKTVETKAKRVDCSLFAFAFSFASHMKIFFVFFFVQNSRDEPKIFFLKRVKIVTKVKKEEKKTERKTH